MVKYNPILELENFISHAILIIVQNSSKTWFFFQLTPLSIFELLN